VTALEPRLYRAAFIPAVVALGVLMFSLEPRPRAAPQVLAADVLFDSRQAAERARQIAAAHPDRRAGGRGDAALGREVAASFARRGFETRVDSFESDGRQLLNVVGRRAGTSRRQIVVLAARDGPVRPDLAGSAADTAALLELSRVLHGRVTRKTIVLASVDGETLGSAGARRFAEAADDRDRIDAVIVVSQVGVGDREAAPLVAWSNDASRGSVGLWRTAADSVRREHGASPAGEHVPGQVARLAAPLGIGAQGPLLARGVEAIRFSGSGELPGAPGAPLDRERLGQRGSAVLRTVTALDRVERPGHGPTAYVAVARQVGPGWVFAALALALLVPPLVAAVDGFARARRRRCAPAGWIPWVVAGAAPPLLGLLAAKALSFLGFGPDLPNTAFAPALAPLDAGAFALLGAALAVTALAGLAGAGLALRAARGAPSLAGAGPGAALALVVALAGLATWALNPWTALVLAPAANAWAVAGLLGRRGRRGAVGLLVLGAVAPLGVAAYYLDRLALGPLEGLWYAFALGVGGHVRTAALALGAVWLAALGWAAACVGARLVGGAPAEARRPAPGFSGGRPVREGPRALVRPASRHPPPRPDVPAASRGPGR
jgi:hypothetical protein